MTAQQLIEFALKELGVANPHPDQLEDGFKALVFEMTHYDWASSSDAATAYVPASLAEEMDVLTEDYHDYFALRVAARLCGHFGQRAIKQSLIAESKLVYDKIEYRYLNSRDLTVPAHAEVI